MLRSTKEWEKVKDVVKIRKDHQHKDKYQSNAKPHLLRPFRQRPAPNSLNSVEQKVTPIEQWHRKQVQKPNGH